MPLQLSPETSAEAAGQQIHPSDSHDTVNPQKSLGLQG